MRRNTRPFLGVFLFIFILLLIILLGGDSGSANKPLAWKHVRYSRTSAVADVSDTIGVCPGLHPNITKPILVVARVDADGDASWLDKLSDKYHLCVYHVATSFDSSSTTPSNHIQHPLNRAHEALPYLTFLTSNYNLLSTSSASPGIAFIHGTRFGWHNDHPLYDNLALLSSLNVSAAVESTGYANLRCDWSAGTCPAGTKAQGSVSTKMQAMTSPWDLRAVSDAALPAAFAKIFGDPRQAMLENSHVLRAQCCAQFVVSVDSIKQHAQEEYAALRQWLLDGVSLASTSDNKVVGRIMSYLWHVLFIKHELVSSDVGKDTIDFGKLNEYACPEDTRDCYCRLYGRCDLEPCGHKGHCAGQYRVPDKFKLDDDWGETHG